VHDKFTQLGKGFAFIEFGSYQEAMHVVEALWSNAMPIHCC